MSKATKPSNLQAIIAVVRYNESEERSGQIKTLTLKATWNPPKNCTDQKGHIYINGKSLVKFNFTKATKVKTRDIDVSGYYPKVDGKYIDKIKFAVQADQKNKTYSAERSYVFTLEKPGIPISGAPQVDSSSYTACTFTWSQNPYDNDIENIKGNHYIYLEDFEWEAALTNSPETPSEETWNEQRNQTITIYDPSSGQPVSHDAHGSIVGTELTIYEGQAAITGNLYRHVRVRARSLAGASDWSYRYYAYGNATTVSADASSAKVTNVNGTNTEGQHSITVSGAGSFNVQCQYGIPSPPRVTLTTDGTWKRAKVDLPLNFDNWQVYEYYVGMTTPNEAFDVPFKAPALDVDEVIFLRDVTVQNGKENEISQPFLVTDNVTYTLPTPTISVTDVDVSNHRVTISLGGAASSITNSIIAIYYRTDANQTVGDPIAIFTSSESSKTVQAPNWGDAEPSFGARAVVADYQTVPYEATDGSLRYKLGDTFWLSSDTKWDTGSVPKPPTNIILDRVREGVMSVEFEWTWTQAQQAEISWSDNPDAWMSTDGPSTYVLSNVHNGRWFISGLGAGIWYVRVRFIRSTEEFVTYGTYSAIHQFSMSSAPDVPSLKVVGVDVSDTAVFAGVDDTVEAYWQYKSNDGTGQKDAYLAEAVYTNGAWSFTEIKDLNIGAASHYNFTPADFGWTEGTTHYLSVRLRSLSNMMQDNWSAPVQIVVASKPTISVTGYGGANDALTFNSTDNEYQLVKLPLEFTVSGGTAAGTTTVIIERAQNFDPLRPNDIVETCFAGETIYLSTIDNGADSRSISIDLDDLIGKLDDEALYLLRVSVKDSYGQVAEYEPIEFRVNWNVQAKMPIASIWIDHDNNVASVTCTEPSGASEGDHCDIYRWSTDGLTLIKSGAEFGEEYVDPYPTLGTFGGYRVVYVTKYGDYKMSDGEFAWVDYKPFAAMANANFYLRDGYAYVGYNDDAENNLGEMSFDISDDAEDSGELYYTYDADAIADFFISNGDLFVTDVGDEFIDKFAIIVDFDGERLFMQANIQLSNTWKKDFQLTRYLGGSMVGDWNPGIERTGSYTANIPVKQEEEAITAMRRLAEFPGACRIRTPEGSNFFANIEVQDTREQKWVNALSQVTLTITRVDEEDDEVLTFTEWVNSMQ